MSLFSPKNGRIDLLQVHSFSHTHTQKRDGEGGIYYQISTFHNRQEPVLVFVFGIGNHSRLILLSMGGPQQAK